MEQLFAHHVTGKTWNVLIPAWQKYCKRLSNEAFGLLVVSVTEV
jgi:hypothetical protein